MEISFKDVFPVLCSPVCSHQTGSTFAEVQGVHLELPFCSLPRCSEVHAGCFQRPFTPAEVKAASTGLLLKVAKGITLAQESSSFQAQGSAQ